MYELNIRNKKKLKKSWNDISILLIFATAKRNGESCSGEVPEW